jgi:hypothetical protein
MVATRMYGGKYDIARKARPWFDSQKAVVKAMP